MSEISNQHKDVLAKLSAASKRRWGDTFADARKNLELRLIGPLQTNKAADAVALFDVIETVDREKLLKALVKAAETAGKMPRLYVQVNTGEEAQKSGVLPAELPAFLKLMRGTYDLEPEGLMCIPPADEAASPHFWMLSNLAKENGVEKLSKSFTISSGARATQPRVLRSSGCATWMKTALPRLGAGGLSLW